MFNREKKYQYKPVDWQWQRCAQVIVIALTPVVGAEAICRSADWVDCFVFAGAAPKQGSIPSRPVTRSNAVRYSASICAQSCNNCCICYHTYLVGIFMHLPTSLAKLQIVKRWPPIDLSLSLSISISAISPQPIDRNEYRIWKIKETQSWLITKICLPRQLDLFRIPLGLCIEVDVRGWIHFWNKLRPSSSFEVDVYSERFSSQAKHCPCSTSFGYWHSHISWANGQTE